MVPHQSGDVGIEEKRSHRGRAGIEREFRTSSQIKHAFVRIRGWCLGVKESPTAIKDGPPEFLRDIDRLQIGRAERGHEQDELEVGHSRILNIERRHGMHYQERDRASQL